MNPKQRIATTAILGGLLCLAACADKASDADNKDAGQTAAAPTEPSIYEAALANSNRPDEDRARDASRKPAEVLQFMGIKPGMTVLDMYTGGGYYAELLSHVVGAEGKVIAQTNEAYLGFVGDAFDARFNSGRLDNVEILMAENNELSLQENSLDAVMLVLSFHDIYLVDAENGWPQINKEAFLAELHKGLKPGGVVAIIDHYAEAGAPSDTGSTVHRIDPAIVVADMEAAGFFCEADSDMLRNPDDDLNKSVFSPDLRGKTDRFVMRFKKQE